MKKWYGLLAASMLCLGVAACGNSSLVAPEAPRLGGGSTIGTGHRNQDTTTVASTTGTTTGGTAPADRGGSTIGSGN